MGLRRRQRADTLGDKPRTVYEFIFGLRGGGAAVKDEFRALVEDGRADIPLLHVAIEQIAGFERPTSIQETVITCRGVESGKQLPAATPDWVHTTLNKQVRKKRLVRCRDCYTTVHRKWAARLIAAGLDSVKCEIYDRIAAQG